MHENSSTPRQPPDLGWVTIPTEEFERLHAAAKPTHITVTIETLATEWFKYREALTQIEAGYHTHMSAAEMASIARQAL